MPEDLENEVTRALEHEQMAQT